MVAALLGAVACGKDEDSGGPDVGATPPLPNVPVSRSAPGGLQTADVPQFIILTFDDGVNTLAISPYAEFISPNTALPYPGPGPAPTPLRQRGSRQALLPTCGIMATWYATFGGSAPNDECNPSTVASPPQSTCQLVQALHSSGHQIATHTCHHFGEPPIQEITGAFDFLNNDLYGCNIPMSDISGFRTPNLDFSQGTFNTLASLNTAGTYSVGWDSSLTENNTNPVVPGTSGFGASFIFPYTMDDGIKQDCSAQGGTCDNTTPNPGLWELPMWFLFDQNKAAIGDGMDPVPQSGESITDMLQNNFIAHYQGNRAPMGLFLHGGVWMPPHGQELATWMQTVLAKYSDVYFVTVKQVLEWMVTPIPASAYELPTCFDVTQPDNHYCFPPNNPAYPDLGCVYGSMDPAKCTCHCMTPYKTDDYGACTIVTAKDL